MRGRIYPRAVLLILVNIIVKASCKGNGSLTFLIDTTSSMTDDIKQVRQSVHRIKEIVLHEKSSLIDNMVLITLNDPGVHSKIATRDPDKFKIELDAIKAKNEAQRPYLDCWEPAMKGLLLALEKSNNNSYIFVFTDAPAKDYVDGQSVIEMCQRKQTQIVFVLTGTLCGKFKYAPGAIDVYSDIAVACSGLSISVQKNEVNKVFGPIEEIIKGNKTVITTATIPAGKPKTIPFTIDDHTDYIIVYAYGKNVSMKINGGSFSQKDILSADNAKAIKLSNANPGSYSATVKGATRTSVLIVGRTDFFFSHGFSESKPNSLSDTSQTVSGAERVYLSISVTDEQKSVKIVSAKLSDMDGKQILTNLPLSEISKDFYITDPFVAPSQRFKVTVNGIVKSTGKFINRTSKIPVTPSPPKVAPKVQGVSIIKVNKSETTQLECKVVKGFPAPKITWLYGDISGSMFTPIDSDSVLVIANAKYKDEGKYKCVAKNEKGKDEHVITLLILDQPKIISSISTAYESTEGDALLKIPCIATGLPKPSITWKLNGAVIIPSAKYSTEDGALIIRDPNISDPNSYTCEAKNNIGAVSATFKTYIRQKPHISGVATKQVRVGSSASIECTVIKGVPIPTITWQFMDSSSSTFSQIAGSDRVLHNISRVENKDAGRYKCTAQNAVGIHEHITTLEVQDVPKIVSSYSTIYQSTEGDAALKIPCIAAGLPKPSITWKLNGRDINPSDKYSVEDGTLIIKDPKVSDPKSYTCEAKNEVGAVSATFRTYIRQKPQVSGVDTKKVRLGSSGSVECTVDKGEPKPTITWQFMDSSSSKFSQISGSDRVLHISRVENKDAGRYKCTAQNAVGIHEHITTLEVQDEPKIVSSYSTVYQSTEGDAALKIPCIAAGLPKPSITWKLNDRDINPSKKYSIEDGTLVIKDPKVSDTNWYTCEAKNEVGAVTAKFKTYIRQKPQVSGVAAKQVRVGSSASIECKITKGEPKPTITWQFMDKSSTVFVQIPGSDQVLLISRVENKHAGRYKCIAQNSVGSDEHFTAIIVQDLPKITSRVSTNYQGTEGDAFLRVPCAATGLPKPSITWKLDGRIINPSEKYFIEDGTLVIKDPKVSDTNWYTCEAKNEVGAVTAKFKTYIRQKPQVSGVAAKQVRVGSSASIECTITKGEPKPTITWQFMDKSSTVFVRIPGSDQVLLISKVENKHAGRYRCIAQNSVGSDEHITEIVVQDPPKILPSVSTIYESTEGDALLRVPCTATGLPKPSISWNLDGRVINPSEKYSIEDGTLVIKYPKVSDTNWYTCEAKNEVGTVTAKFRSNIRQKPQVSGVAAKQVRVGSSASIECTITKGEPKPTITWQFMDKSSTVFVRIPGSDQVLLISKVENKHAGRYKCIAQNSVGSDEHITAIVVQDPPKVLSSVSIIYESTEGDASLRVPCAANGLPKPSIIWKLDGRVINPSEKYSIEDGTLVIKDPKVSDTNWYTCEAKNEVGTVTAKFKTYIRQKPQVSGVAAKQVRVGSSASIECTITKGEPKPTITWQFMDKSSTVFVRIPGSDQVLHISKVENKHAGRYKCIAQNSVGSDEHITAIVVQDPPKVLSSVSIIYESTEGDASLRVPCAANGLPKPSIIWKLDGRVINPSEKYSIEDGTLVIKDPKVSDTNWYTCEVKNEVGAVTAKFKTYIRQKPQVSGVAAKQVRVGSSASIECTITKGEPKPTITWHFLDKSSTVFVRIPGSDQVLLISKVENTHYGRYKCIAQNSVGSDEHITAIVVQDLPKITSRVSTIYQGTEGDAFLRVPCAATGLPKPSITWKLDGHIINSSEKYSIEDGTLVIKDPKVSDTNWYTCEAKNEVGAVTAKFKTYIRQKPQVSGVAAIQVRVGSSASIECKFDKGEPKPTITWHFSDNYGSNFLPIAGSDQVLHISRVENKHAGRYKCVAQNSVGSDEHITTVVVQDPPKILPSISTIYESNEGDALLRVPCTATGLPKPSIIWKLDGRVINPSVKYSIEDGTLVIKDPKVSDTNSYTCEARNEVGSISATFKTYIRQAPKLSGLPAEKVRIGKAANIKCTVKGEPKPSITWQFMDQSNAEFLPIPGSENVLHISKVENKHAGRYKCVAQNDIGSAEHITTLEVQDPPVIVSSVSSNYQSTEGDALLRIPCSATGQPKPSITWKLNDHVINPNTKYAIEDGTLVIRNPKVSDTNSYTCEAKNEVGAVSTTFRTYIRQLPELSGVTSKNVRIGTSVDIECIIYQGEPKPKITWQYMDKSASKFVPIPGSETTLRITNAEKKHAGRYKCVAQNNVGSDEHVTTLNVEYLQGITINSTTVDGIIGDLALRIPCNVVGVPQPIITWKLNGITITPNGKYSIEDGALVIAKPGKTDSSSDDRIHVYTCEAKSSIGTVSTTFKAAVSNYPESFGTIHYVNIKQGESKNLECEAYNNSGYQSVKWFETKEDLQYMDSLLSTTSSTTDLDSLETTTSSSGKDYSTTSRITTMDTDNTEPYFKIVNASLMHDGNYTCRVSDKHGNTQTHTYVVDVGIPPEFIIKDLSINHWRGDKEEIKKFCDVKNDVKPQAEVQWRFNGKELTDLNSVGVGHYTCNVSNVHGSELKQFDVKSSDCLITRNLRDAQYMPLILDDEGFWHKLKTTYYYIIVEQEGKITLSCPSQKEKSNTFKNFPEKSTLEAICKEDSFLVDGKTYKLSHLQCTNSIQPSVVRKKVKCSTENSELIRVGYNVPGFLEAYEVCFDHKLNMPLYTRIIMTDANDNGESAGYNWYTYPGIDNKQTERGFTCKDRTSSCCYSKSQLVNAIDFNEGPAKKSTFIDPLNVIPVWLPCHSNSKSPWEDMNDKVRSQVPTYDEIVVWSGTHTFQEKNGAVIPRYLWKVVKLADDEVMAIVYVNDPKPTDSDIKCKRPEICDNYENWIVGDNSTYCCSLPDFLKSFGFHDTDFGESLEAAQDSMKKST